jgi:hypothetical protein
MYYFGSFKVVTITKTVLNPLIGICEGWYNNRQFSIIAEAL